MGEKFCKKYGYLATIWTSSGFAQEIKKTFKGMSGTIPGSIHSLLNTNSKEALQ